MVKILERGVEISTKKLHPNPWNPNERNDFKSKALSESIDRYPQFAEILIRPHPDLRLQKAGEYQIINGEHRYREYLRKGLPTIVATIVEADDVEAKKLTLIANDGGENNEELLAALLKDLAHSLGDNLDEMTHGTSIDLDEVLSSMGKGLGEEVSEEVGGEASEEVSGEPEECKTTLKKLVIIIDEADFDHANQILKQAYKSQIPVSDVLIHALETALEMPF
jgi:ParB-like chromosome segregation protein Spo0J